MFQHPCAWCVTNFWTRSKKCYIFNLKVSNENEQCTQVFIVSFLITLTLQQKSLWLKNQSLIITNIQHLVQRLIINVRAYLCIIWEIRIIIISIISKLFIIVKSPSPINMIIPATKFFFRCLHSHHLHTLFIHISVPFFSSVFVFKQF